MDRKCADDERRLAALDAATADTRRPVVSGADLARALAALDALPAVAKRLRRIDPARLSLAPGASLADLDAVEAALGQPLLPEHRALLQAFDGGRIVTLILPGTPAGGGRGRDDLVASSRLLTARRGVAWAVTVALGANGSILAARLRKKPDVLLQKGWNEETLESARKLDGLLDAMIKAAQE